MPKVKIVGNMMELNRPTASRASKANRPEVNKLVTTKDAEMEPEMEPDTEQKGAES